MQKDNSLYVKNVYPYIYPNIFYSAKYTFSYAISS